MNRVRWGAFVLLGTACSTGTVACGSDSSTNTPNPDGGAGVGGLGGAGNGGASGATTGSGGVISSSGATTGSGGEVTGSGGNSAGGSTGAGGANAGGTAGASSGGASSGGAGGSNAAGAGGSNAAGAGGSNTAGAGGASSGGAGGANTAGAGGASSGGAGGANTAGAGGASSGGAGGSNAGGASSGGTAGAGGANAGGTAGANTGGTAGTGGVNAGGTGGVAGCGADNTACTLSGNKNGFCSSNVCTACAGPADNASCSAAYGSGTGYVCVAGSCTAGNCIANTDCPNGGICGITTANQCDKCSTDGSCVTAYGSGYLCTAAGACVQGDCKADADCPTGEICGVTKANNCGKCTTDTECKNDATYGSSFVCNTATGACVAGTCSQNSKSCPSNGADFCCGGACVEGNCCSAPDCASMGNNFACVNHACTQCAQATNNTYVVDPVNGSDTIGTGNGATAACAFRTIARALTVIGSAPNPGTKVLVAATGSVGTATGETFPVVVPTNVTIGAVTTAVTVLVPSGLAGFSLAKPSSGLADLVIDGQNHTATSGVVATAGSADSTSISNVTVKNMASDGIRVAGTGVLSIGVGVSSTGNGVAGNNTAADGLHVQDQGKATIAVASGAAPTHFDSNSAHGIFVTGNGSINLTGVAGTGGDGTVTANGNTLAGLWIEQTPAANPAMNTVTGLVSWANTGNGIRAVAGSALTLRKSFVLANQTNGVMVSTLVVNNTQTNDVSHLDLGASGSAGANVLQASLGQNPNGGAGICLAINRTAGGTLKAEGNVFSGPRNCATANPGTLTRNATCANAVDVSVRVTGPTTNTIDVANCQ